MPKKKPEKSANDMTDEELITSVFPRHVVERIEREVLKKDEAEKEEEHPTPRDYGR